MKRLNLLKVVRKVFSSNILESPEVKLWKFKMLHFQTKTDATKIKTCKEM